MDQLQLITLERSRCDGTVVEKHALVLAQVRSVAQERVQVNVVSDAEEGCLLRHSLRKRRSCVVYKAPDACKHFGFSFWELRLDLV